MTRRNLSRYSHALRYALSLVEKMGGNDVVLVPLAPSATMVDCGARAGKVSGRTAATIYRAMVESAQ